MQKSHNKARIPRSSSSTTLMGESHHHHYHRKEPPSNIFHEHVLHKVNEMVDQLSKTYRRGFSKFKDILVVFDWDETLYGRMPSLGGHRRPPIKSDSKHVYPHTRPLLQDLYISGIKMIILTRRTSDYHIIQTLQEEQLDHYISEILVRQKLAQLPQRQVLRDGHINMDGRSSGPLWDVSVIPKGETLTHYFQSNRSYPKGVIFVDDLRPNRISVDASMKALNIACTVVDAYNLNKNSGY